VGFEGVVGGGGWGVGGGGWGGRGVIIFSVTVVCQKPKYISIDAFLINSFF